MGISMTREELLEELKKAYKPNEGAPENAISFGELANSLGITVFALKTQVEAGKLPEGWEVKTFRSRNGRDTQYFVKTGE